VNENAERDAHKFEPSCTACHPIVRIPANTTAMVTIGFRRHEGQRYGNSGC
jgi:hypothetical protein